MLRSLRSVIRLVIIGRTLARRDALFALEWLPGGRWGARALRLMWRRRGADGRPGERLAVALQDLGPSFIKFGQALSTRPDLVGDAVARDLAQLQDKLPPFATADAIKTVEEQLDGQIDGLFATFEETPVAAASIAQVHFATVADPDGEQAVAVKILRPGVEAAFARDLELFRWLAEMVERVQPKLRRLKPVAAVETFAETVRQEMDLRLEAAAAAELADNFRDDDHFRVPAVDWSRTAQRVLTTARIDGVAVHDKAAIKALGHDPGTLVARAAAVFFNQVFRDGFFHGDMHPGNLFVAPDGALVPVDFGIMGRLDRKTRYYLADMLLGFLTRDYDRVVDVHFRAGYVPAHQSRGAFKQAARAIAEPIFDRPTGDISIARLLAQLFTVTEQFEMEAQPQLLLLQKTMLLSEGVGRMLAPGTNMWVLALPLVEEWMRQHRGPEARLAEAMVETGRALARLPEIVTALEREAAVPDPVMGDGPKNGHFWRLAAVFLLGAVAALLALG